MTKWRERMMTIQDRLQEQFSDKTVYFYQKDDCGFLRLTQRSGKIKISVLVFQKLLSPGARILVSYPDNLIKDSWIKDFEKWGYVNNNVVFANFDSLKKHTEEHWDMFLMDEVHLLPPTDLGKTKAQQIVRNSKYTLGLSGTMSKDTQKNVREWFGMKEIASYEAEQAISDGIIADYQVTIHFVDLDNKVKQYKNSKGVLQTEKGKFDAYTWIIEKNKREGKDNMFMAIKRNDVSKNSIAKSNKVKELLSLHQNKRVIVFSGLSKIADSYGIPSYHSKKDDKDFQAFHRGEFNHLALAVKGSTGSTYHNLDSVIISNFTSNEENLSQTISRAVLLDYSGKTASIDIIALDEPNERKKLMGALSMLSPQKIKIAK